MNFEYFFVCKRRKGRPPDSHGSSRRTKTEPGGEGGGIGVGGVEVASEESVGREGVGRWVGGGPVEEGGGEG